MNDKKQGMFVPALIGGAIAGVLTALPLVGCLCCVWIIGGAIVACYLYSKNLPVPMTSGDGAILGIFTGIIGAVIDFFVSIPFDLMSKDFIRNIMERVATYAEDLPEGWENWFERGGIGDSVPFMMLGLVISVVVFSALGALGGIIGASLISKKKIEPDT